MSLLTDPILGASASVVLAVVLGVAAIHKLVDRDRFREALRAYRVLPGFMVPTIAAGVPVLEVAACLLLLAPQTRWVGAPAVAVLLGSYALAIGWNLARGRTEIDCGCSFGGGGQPLSGWLVARNALLLPVAAIAARSWEWEARPVGSAFGLADCLVVAAVSACALLFYYSAERLIANHALVESYRRSS